ncbi:hypothetical protein BGW80DRAFT_654975 [Lactifluus volemus]|nr:hypothetical protein BGW80DRAFT_654975 [Lactifluus volemus]
MTFFIGLRSHIGSQEWKFGDDVKEMLTMSRVPIVLVFTKYDMIISQDRMYDYEESCHRLLGKRPRDVPAEIVSSEPGFGDFISKLVETTHRLVAADPHNATALSSSFEAQRSRAQISPVSLAWSIAQRVSRDVNIQASILIGRSRYWHGLASSRDFAGRPLESCIDVIHADIVDIWNLRDPNMYLWSGVFKAQMSHLVEDLAGPLPGAPSTSNQGWAGPATPAGQNLYQNTTENICCIMGYIVDLTVILHELFLSGHDVSGRQVQSVMDRHDKSGPKSQIHNDIRRFLSGTASFTSRGSDMIPKKIIDLIAQNCRSAPGSN